MISNSTQSPVDEPGAGSRLQKIAADRLRAEHFRLVTEVGLLAVLTLLIPALLDYIYFWPLSVRCAVEFGWALLMVAVLMVTLRQWREARSVKSVALELERRRPEVRCDVSTAAEYATRPDIRPLQNELISGLQQRSDSHLEKIAPPYRRYSLVWLAALTMVCVLVAIPLVLIPASRLAAERVLLPWTLPQYTRIAVTPGQTESAIKSDLSVTAIFGGRLPLQSRIEWRHAKGTWHTDEMLFTEAHSATYKFPNLHEDFTYRVTANDAMSPEFQVSLYSAPEVKSWHIQAIPPAYAQQSPQYFTTGDVETLRGATLEWQIVPTHALSNARLHFEKDAPDFPLQSDHGIWKGGMTLKGDADYHLLLTDTARHGNLNPALNHLVAIPDAPPEVDIVTPEEIIAADPNDKISITVEATDDIGLNTVDLIYQNAGHPSATIPLFPPGTGRSMSATTILDLAPMKLNPYDVVIYHAEGRDYNTYDGPGIGRSHVQFIVIRGPVGAKPPQPLSNGAHKREINLSQLERDLIGGTTNLPEKATRDSMQDLATAQDKIRQETSKIGDIMIQENLNPAITAAITFTLNAMNNASAALNAGDRAQSLDQEALALAGLFQVARFMPNSVPSSAVSDLLVTMEDPGTKEGRHRKRQEQLNQALTKAVQIERGEKTLGVPNGGQGPGEPEKPVPASGGAEKQKEQDKLAAEARGLADFLSKAAATDSTIGHHLAKSADNVAAQMDTAAHELSRGDFNPAKVSIAQRSSIVELENLQTYIRDTLAADDHGASDDETIPPEYADQLAHYFQKLSHEK